MFKKKALQVKMVDAPPENGMGMTKPMAQKPNPFYEASYFVETQLPRVMKAVLIYKLATTALSAAEHIVVTKVK